MAVTKGNRIYDDIAARDALGRGLGPKALALWGGSKDAYLPAAAPVLQLFIVIINILWLLL